MLALGPGKFMTEIYKLRKHLVLVYILVAGVTAVFLKYGHFETCTWIMLLLGNHCELCWLAIA